MRLCAASARRVRSVMVPYSCECRVVIFLAIPVSPSRMGARSSSKTATRGTYRPPPNTASARLHELLPACGRLRTGQSRDKSCPTSLLAGHRSRPAGIGNPGHRRVGRPVVTTMRTDAITTDPATVLSQRVANRPNAAGSAPRSPVAAGCGPHRGRCRQVWRWVPGQAIRAEVGERPRLLQQAVEEHPRHHRPTSLDHPGKAGVNRSEKIGFRPRKRHACRATSSIENLRGQGHSDMLGRRGRPGSRRTRR